MYNLIERIVKKLLEANGYAYFMFLCLAAFTLLFLKKNLIESEIPAFEVLAQEGKMGFINTLNTLQYLSIPFYYLWIFTVGSFILWVGCFMFGYKVSYPDTWKIIMVGQTVFIIPEILKIIWFLQLPGDITLQEVRAFYPLSITHFFDHQTINDQWIYPVKAINIFEVLNWIILVFGVYSVSRKNLKISAYIVLSSYVLFFFIWLLFYILVYK